MIIKSYVIDNGFLKVLSTLDDSGIKVHIVNAEVKTPVTSLDVVSSDEKKIILSVNGKEELTVSLEEKKEEIKEVKTEVPEVKSEEVKTSDDEKQKEEEVVITASARPNKKTASKTTTNKRGK
mgnify:CR=1 FL=1